MMRYATIEDYDFIFSLILKEASNGHFARNLLIPAAMASGSTWTNGYL